MKLRNLHIIAWFVIIVFCLLATGVGYLPSAYLNNTVLVHPSAETLKEGSNGYFQNVVDELGDKDYHVVKQYAMKYSIDPRLILAIMKQESQFDVNAISTRGALGLMQLMPITSAEIAENLQLEEYDLSHGNIQSGIYYFAKLFDLFSQSAPEDRLCLALAAYNAGPSRIYDAQELAAYIGENPNSWTSIEKVLPLLSKRFYSLHASVWSDGKPKSGYFGSWRQTVIYVESTMKIYRDYLQMKG